jgi:hypothetical protein
MNPQQQETPKQQRQQQQQLQPTPVRPPTGGPQYAPVYIREHRFPQVVGHAVKGIASIRIHVLKGEKYHFKGQVALMRMEQTPNFQISFRGYRIFDDKSVSEEPIDGNVPFPILSAVQDWEISPIGNGPNCIIVKVKFPMSPTLEPNSVTGVQLAFPTDNQVRIAQANSFFDALESANRERRRILAAASFMI